jgi:hypothetical protein
MQLALAVLLEGEKQERGRDAVADTGLDRNLRLQFANQLIEPQALVVPVTAGDATGVVPVTALRLTLDGVPEVRRLVLEMRDQPALANLVLSSADGYFFGRPSSTPVGR